MVLTLVTSTPVILFTMSGTLKGKIYFIHLEDHLHHQIWKYFAHLEHHHQIFKYWNILPTLTITSSTSLVIRAAPTSPEPSETWQKSLQSQKSKIKGKLFKLSTSIIFPHHCDFLRLWKWGGNFGRNLWKTKTCQLYAFTFNFAKQKYSFTFQILNCPFAFGKVWSIMSTMAASLYSFQASAFFAIFSACIDQAMRRTSIIIIDNGKITAAFKIQESHLPT